MNLIMGRGTWESDCLLFQSLRAALSGRRFGEMVDNHFTGIYHVSGCVFDRCQCDRSNGAPAYRADVLFWVRQGIFTGLWRWDGSVGTIQSEALVENCPDGAEI